MFAKPLRISGKKEFEKILSEGKILRNKFSKIFYTENDDSIRLSVLAGKKSVSQKAVLRNRAKRRVREAIKKNLGILDDIGVSMIVFCNSSSIKSDFNDIVEEFKNSFYKIKENINQKNNENA